MTLLNFDTQIVKIYFNFFHIYVDFKFKKDQTTSLVQKPYFVAIMWQSLLGFIPIFRSPRALTFFEETSCKLFVNT